MALPNLIIIGAMKCGTTSLHSYLDLHPEIQMSNPKELDFFNDDEKYNKGLSWYSDFFKDGYKYNGESSVNYSKRHSYPSVPSRIKSDLGKDIKLIYVVRDPVDRFQSNFTDSKTYGHIPSGYSINEFIENTLEHNPLIKTSMYYYQIENYLSHFDLKNMFFLKAEDLKKSPQATLDRVFDFLGLEPVAVERIEQNQSTTKTYYSTKYLKLTQLPIVRGLKRLMPKQMISTISSSQVIQNISRKKINPVIDTISEENRNLLKNYFKDDMMGFQNLTNIKF